MRISRKTDYAMRVLFTLLDEQGTRPVSIRVLAEKNQIPKPFLEHIMLEMKAEGWVKSTPGKNGGYILNENPEKITMGEIVRCFDGPHSLLSDHENLEATDDGQGIHRFRRVLLQIRNMTFQLMDQATLASVKSTAPVVLFQDEVMGGLGI